MPKTATASKQRRTPTNAVNRRKRRKKSQTSFNRSSDELALVKKLMSIPGKSGQEAQVARFIEQELWKAGVAKTAIKFDAAHKRTPIDGQIGNLAVQIPGTMRGPRRLLMAHMDTVPVCVGSQPVQRGSLLRSANPKTGLGADNRAGVAVVLNTALRILRDKPEHPPLTCLWTVQEEIGLHGARNVRLGMLGKPKLAFNWDGGSPAKLTIGATGGYRMAITVRGIASHAGNAPEAGVSAIAIASVAIAELQASGWHGLIIKKGKRGTANVGVIQGGNATNVVTDEVVIRAEARSHDPKFRKQIVSAIERAFGRAVCKVKNSKGQTGSVEIGGSLDYESFQLDKAEPCVMAAEQAVRCTGAQPVFSVTNGGVDANWMVLHGIPTTTLGCGQVNPHMTSEALNIGEFRKACKIAWHLATDGSAA
jgi:tripeptide aminopeptidase